MTENGAHILIGPIMENIREDIDRGAGCVLTKRRNARGDAPFDRLPREKVVRLERHTPTLQCLGAFLRADLAMQ